MTHEPDATMSEGRLVLTIPSEQLNDVHTMLASAAWHGDHEYATKLLLLLVERRIIRPEVELPA